MKASMKWLREYVDINVDVQELADRLTMNGLEIEGWESRSASITGVVTGKIEKIEKHPDADKLVICQVNVGDEVLQIVTGANNVFEGAVVPVAMIGACLTGGLCIKDGKLRGVPSHGMLCSGEELGLTEEEYKGAGVYGILILPEDLPIGVNIWQAIGLDDTIIDFKVTANRADCHSIIGLAREISVALGTPLRMPEPKVNLGQPSDKIKVQVKDTDLCPRYMAAVVENVKIAPSPVWMQQRLESAGVRAISNIVDITNYVMLETGQPMHAFDIRYIEGGQIVVRTAEKGETITTLDDKERELTDDMLVICDEKKPIALAGIMGGKNSEIMEDTATVVFESAKFRRDSVRHTARTLGLRSESSNRFEKGIDIVNTEFALNRALQLIEELGAGQVTGGNIDLCGQEIKDKELQVAPEQINELLGMEIPVGTMVEILNRLYITTTYENGVLNCKIPSFREDVEMMADLAEEILRIYGYDRISAEFSLKVVPKSDKMTPHKAKNMIKRRLISHGMYEVATYSFTTDKAFNMMRVPEDSSLRQAIRLINPLGEDQSVMRTTLIHSLLNVVSTNTSRKVKEGRIFEINNVYIPHALPLTELPDEIPYLGMATFGQGEDFYALKSVIFDLLSSLGFEAKVRAGGSDAFHPYRKAEIVVRNRVIGQMGQIHPEVLENYGIDTPVFMAEIDLTMILTGINVNKKFKALPKYPAVERDIAVVVAEDVEIGPMMDQIRSVDRKILEKVALFDIFKGAQLGEGLKSVAFSLSFRHQERTLTDTEVNEVFNKILKRLEDQFQARLR